MNRERRRSERIRKRLKVQYGISELDQKGYCGDVSVGGIFLVARRLYKVNCRLHLKLNTEKDTAFFEGRVARLHQVPEALRRLDPQGMGVQFLHPADLITALVPRVERRVDTLGIDCPTQEELRTLLKNQLSTGMVLVACGDPPPAINTTVEFEVRLGFVPGGQVKYGMGRVTQLLELADDPTRGKQANAVIEVQNVAKLCAALEIYI